jgi:hypothetical protein
MDPSVLRAGEDEHWATFKALENAVPKSSAPPSTFPDRFPIYEHASPPPLAVLTCQMLWLMLVVILVTCAVTEHWRRLKSDAAVAMLKAEADAKAAFAATLSAQQVLLTLEKRRLTDPLQPPRPPNDGEGAPQP